MALQIGIGGLGGVVASNVYLSEDAPRYVLGRELYVTSPECTDT